MSQTEQEQRITGLADKWIEDAKSSGLTPVEIMTAIGHLTFSLLIEETRIDIAMRDLADIYITLTQRLLSHFGVQHRARARRPEGQ